MASLGVGINSFLCLIKLAGGYRSDSVAMLTDGIHSAADILITLVAFTRVKIAARGPDEKHPQGYGKYELLTALILGTILLISGVGIEIKGVVKIKAADQIICQPPGELSIVIAVLSIIFKIGAYKYMMLKSTQIGSHAFAVEAKHQLADAVSSLGALTRGAGKIMGVWYMESAVCVSIFALIIKNAAEIIYDFAGHLICLASDRK